MKEKFEIDDLGNIVQFYDTAINEIVAYLNREDEVDDVQGVLTWTTNNQEVEEWAKTHGYKDEIEQAKRITLMTYEEIKEWLDNLPDVDLPPAKSSLETL